MTQLTFLTVTKAGGCRSGGDSHGANAHLLVTPAAGRVPGYVFEGYSLCGEQPRIMWSDWAPDGADICPRCAIGRDILTHLLEARRADLAEGQDEYTAGQRSLNDIATAVSDPNRRKTRNALNRLFDKSRLLRKAGLDIWQLKKD